MSRIQLFNDWITLPDAHELLGTNSPADDASIQSMIYSLGAMITSYLGRELRHAEFSEIFFRPEGQYLSVDNWPIISITSIDNDGTAVADPDADFDIDYSIGMLHYSNEGLSFTGTQPKRITVQYISGYTALPEELVVMFNTLLVNRNDAGGGAAEGGTGEIKKVSLTGVAAVEFATSGSQVSYSGVDRLSGVPEELKPYVGLINKYRSDETMGIV